MDYNIRRTFVVADICYIFTKSHMEIYLHQFHMHAMAALFQERKNHTHEST